MQSFFTSTVLLSEVDRKPSLVLWSFPYKYLALPCLGAFMRKYQPVLEHSWEIYIFPRGSLSKKILLTIEHYPALEFSGRITNLS